MCNCSKFCLPPYYLYFLLKVSLSIFYLVHSESLETGLQYEIYFSLYLKFSHLKKGVVGTRAKAWKIFDSCKRIKIFWLNLLQIWNILEIKQNVSRLILIFFPLFKRMIFPVEGIIYCAESMAHRSVQINVGTRTDFVIGCIVLFLWSLPEFRVKFFVLEYWKR